MDLALNNIQWLICHKTLPKPNAHTHTHTHTHTWGLSTLAKEFSTAACIMQSSLKELSTLVADRV